MSLLTQPKFDHQLRNHLIRDAIGLALYQEMVEDPAIHLLGEGAHMKVHFDAPQIERDMPDRVHTLPISEDGNTNFCVGAALLGVKPVVDVIAADFLYRTMDSICNTAAKLDFLSGREHTIVIRSEFFTAGPTTGQRPESLFTHIPGLNVVVPSTPRDAHGLMRTALRTPGVTLFFEDRMIADAEMSETDQRLSGRIGFGYALERRNGSVAPDVTIVTYGLMRQVVESALTPAMNVDLLDLRTVYPIDWMSLNGSVRRSHNLLIIEPDVVYGGVGAEIAAHVVEDFPGTRIKRLGAPREVLPAAPSLHPQISQQDVVDAINSF